MIGSKICGKRVSLSRLSLDEASVETVKYQHIIDLTGCVLYWRQYRSMRDGVGWLWE